MLNAKRCINQRFVQEFWYFASGLSGLDIQPEQFVKDNPVCMGCRLPNTASHILFFRQDSILNMWFSP